MQTTQQSAGTAAVLSVQSGAAVVYVREALTTFFDPYSQASSNVYQYISECRLALASPRCNQPGVQIAYQLTMILENNMIEKQIKVKVIDRWRVIHDDKPYAKMTC